MRAPLGLAALGLVGGVLLGDHAPAWLWLALGALAVAASFLGLRRRHPQFWVVLLLGMLAVGALREALASDRYVRLKDSCPLRAEAVETVEAEVLDRLDLEDAGRRRVRWRLALSTGGEVTASLWGDAPGRPGEKASVTGRFRPPAPSSNPGGFDSLSWARHQEVLGSLSVGGPDGIRTLGPAPGMLAALRRVREVLRLRLEQALPGRDGALLGALLLGVREPLDEELSDAFLETGTVHYLSVSGAHVVMVLWVLSRLLALAGMGVRPRAVALILGAAAYAALTGMQAPVLRAALAAGLAAGAQALGRPRASLNAVCAAACLLVLASPGQAFRIGFQLSFLAAGGILLLAPGFKALLAARKNGEAKGRLPAWPVRYVLDGLGVSLAAWLSVLPLVAAVFHLVTPGILLTNLLVCPLVAACMASGAAAMLSPMLFSGLAQLSVRALTSVVEACARIPFGHAYVAEVPSWLVLAAYVWLALLAWRMAWPASRPPLSVRSLAALGLLLSAVAVGRPLPVPPARAVMLDVRQGLCVLIQAPGGGTLLYDCGSYGDPQAGARTMAPALWALGVRRIDVLAVSHGHDDHFNGLAALSRRFAIGRVVAPRHALDLLGPKAEALASGDRIDLGGGADAEVLHPPEGFRTDANNASLCLRVTLPDRRLLLTGDLEGEGVALLLASGRDLSADVLVVPHHGGYLGPLTPFLAVVKPREAWVSAREGFPSPATMETLRSCSTRVRETWKEGAIMTGGKP